VPAVSGPPAKAMGRPRKHGERQAFMIRLDKVMHARLRHMALDRVGPKGEPVSVNDLISEAVMEWWARQPDRGTYEKLVALKMK
jgi:hypothetical protein